MLPQPLHRVSSQAIIISVGEIGSGLKVKPITWIDKHLISQRMCTHIPNLVRNTRCQVSAGAVSANSNLCGIYVELSCMLMHPEKGFVAIIKRGWIFMLRRFLIVNCNNHRVGEHSHILKLRIIFIDVVKNTTPTVVINHGVEWSRTRRLVNICNHICRWSCDVTRSDRNIISEWT